MQTLESLKWRSSIKKFDPTKKISETDLEKIIEAGNLAATSAGLQPFKLIVVRNKEIRQMLRPASWGQGQITDASHLIVFATDNEIGERQIEDYLSRIAEVRNVEKNSLTGMKDMLHGFMATLNAVDRQEWAANQAFISLGTVLAAAAELKIDTTPIGGFDPQQYTEILDLNSKGLKPVVVLALGYRSDEDVYSKAPKVRKKRNDFVVEID